MTEMKLLNLVRLCSLNDKDKLVSVSLADIARENKTVRYDEIVFIIFITIFLLLFFARKVEVFLFLLTFELIIGTLWLVKNKWINAIVIFLLKSLRGCKFSWR